MRAVIFGAGDYGCVFLEYVCEGGDLEVLGFLDDSVQLQGTAVEGLPVLGTRAQMPMLLKKGVEAIVVAIGNGAVRDDILTKCRKLGYVTPNLIHQTAIVPSSTRFGTGVYVLPGVILMPNVTFEDNVIVSVGTIVGHDTVFKRGVFVASSAHIGARITIRERAFIGMGATLMTGVKNIGRDSIVGAGAVVIRDVPDKAVVAGVPAKVLRIRDDV